MSAKHQIAVLVIILLILGLILLQFLEKPPVREIVEKEFVLIGMPEDGETVTSDLLELDLYTNAADGFLVVEVNKTVVSAGAVRPEAVKLENLAIQLQKSGFNVGIRDDIRGYFKSAGPFYLTSTQLMPGENRITAYLLKQTENPDMPLEIADKASIRVTRSLLPLPLLATIFITNVTFNNTVIARMNVTIYNVSDIPRAGTMTIFNGTHNTTVNFTGIGRLWINVRFQDVGPVPPGFTDWRWIQVLTTNLDRAFPPPPQIYPQPISFVDPPSNTPGEDGEPFYYNPGEIAARPELRHLLIDHPTRPKIVSSSGGTVPVNWTQELCHVGVRAGPDVILDCITYGFSIDAQDIVRLQPIQRGTPGGSQNFRDTLRRDFPGYDFQ